MCSSNAHSVKGEGFLTGSLFLPTAAMTCSNCELNRNTIKTVQIIKTIYV